MGHKIYPWKKHPSSLPNNFSQVRKKLEAIERCLMKNPENAARYDKQIKEMEEMQFSRKLSSKERKGQYTTSPITQLYAQRRKVRQPELCLTVQHRIAATPSTTTGSRDLTSSVICLAL